MNTDKHRFIRVFFAIEKRVVKEIVMIFGPDLFPYLFPNTSSRDYTTPKYLPE